MRILVITWWIVLALVFFGCTKQEVDDSTITAKVKGRLAMDKDTSAIKIAVETHDGIVTLTGVVPTEREKQAAGQVAKNTEGVKRVVNAITVNPSSIGASNAKEKFQEATERAKEKVGEAAESAGEVLNESAIKAKIKSQLLANGITGAHVDVMNGEVTIKGEVENAQQRAKAEEIARATKGVHRVNNQLTIKKK